MFPGKFYLTAEVAPVTAYLKSRNWLAPEEVVLNVGRAGEGNMNCVLRVVTSGRTFILKQSRPWVEKYPSIAAPWDRALVEARFYSEVQRRPAVAAYLPALLAVDPDERLLMLESLGDAEDLTFWYADGTRPEQAELDRLIDFLIALHASFRTPELAVSFSNTEMRALNHEHVFALPLRPQNGLDLDALTPGLLRLAQDLQLDSRYCGKVTSLGERYRDTSQGVCLIHGDYFPGSWLKARQSVYVIDPEFCFYGPPEWDLGVMTAHLYFAGLPPAAIDGLLCRYAESAPADRALVWQFAGVELMRRLIGVAQLPVKFSLERKAKLLRLSQTLVLQGRAA